MLNAFIVKLRHCILALTSFILVSNAYSQCAGSDNTPDPICNKELDASLQTYNLFNQLGGNPSSGGSWVSNDPFNQNALNAETGILNIWGISKSGSHSFTYTNSICNQSATVTILLGGYAGEDNIDGSANACNIDSNVDLFSFLNNNISGVNPDIDGTWEQISNNGDDFLNGKFFDATQAAPGLYTFRYTVEAVGSCASSFSTIQLEVHREPISGEPTNLKICASEDLSIYTNVNLLDLLEDEDTNGIWSEINGTNQITNDTDASINLQEIFNNFGAGDYSFTYTVSPTHGVCNISESIVTVSIPEISAALQVNNVCNSESLFINVVHTNSNDDSFSYDLEYEIINSATNNVEFTETRSIDISNPETTTIELPENTINNAGNYTISAKSITNFDGVICNSFQIQESTFTVFGPRVSISQLCFDGPNADILIENLIDNNGNLVSDTFTFNYTVEDTINGTTRNFTNQTITFANGSATLPIDISSFPENAIDYNLKIQSNTNQNFGCIDFDFSADIIPEDITLDFLTESSCNDNTVEAVINAPILSNGSYTINYTITNQETTNIVANNTISLVSGITNYNIDVTSLPVGNYDIILQSTQNDTNQCRTEFQFENSTTFTINPPTPLPVLETNQTFCVNSSTVVFEPKISDIVVTSGENLIWYETVNSETPIDTNSLLIDGEDYYVTSSNPAQNCINSERIPVIVQIITPAGLTSDNVTPVFCDSENPNLANLNINENTNNILWYDAPTNGNLLNLSAPLVNGQSYYAVENINGCEFDTRLEFNVTINQTPTAPILDANQSFCINSASNIFEPKISDIQVTSGENLIWYESNTSNTPLDVTTLLVNGEDYFVTSTDTSASCSNSGRVAVTVALITTSIINATDVNPVFCDIDTPIIADLNATATTGQVLWYDALTGGNLVSITTPLLDGASYFAVENINGCEFDTRLEFNVRILPSIMPEYTGSTELCALDNLTLENLETDIAKDDAFELIWYDAATDGTILDNTTELQEDVEYYVAGINGGCESERLLITVSLSNCDPDKFDFFIPDAFSPNNDGRNDTYLIPNIMFTFPNYEMEIFNRYGQSVTKLNQDNPEWNGENAKTGKVTTSGVYFYVLNYNSNSLKPKQGRIYLSK